MIVSEKEARTTMWCPMVRVGEPGRGAAVNSTKSQIGARLTCIGAACMGWRESPLTLGVDKNGEDIFGGYCGFAGKPEV